MATLRLNLFVLVSKLLKLEIVCVHYTPKNYKMFSDKPLGNVKFCKGGLFIGKLPADFQ